MSWTVALSVVALFLWFGTTAHAQAPAATGTAGETSVQKWKDGKKAVFLLAYDDSCPTHIDKAIPELHKRGLVGTFYINAGNGPYKNRTADWKKIVTNPAVVLGNHTFTHVGATSIPQLDTELAKANEVIFALRPDLKALRLVSFAQPGGVPWTVDKEEAKTVLTKHNLVSRPPFNGPPLSHKTLEEGLKIVDAAITKGEMGHIDFHGVGGDWHVAPMDYYIPLLDRLQSDSKVLWVTDHISYHKYEQERKSAKVAMVAADDKQIRLTLASDTDPALYDLPLTLKTRVPAAWKTCTITQGQTKNSASVIDGAVQYDALPSAQEIVLQP